MFEGIIINLIPRKGKLNIIENDYVKHIIEKYIEKEDHVLIKFKINIFEHILLSYEMKFTRLNNNLIKWEGNIIDETGFYKKGKFSEFHIKGELVILEITEEGMKGKLKIDSDVVKCEGESLNGLLHGIETI